MNSRCMNGEAHRAGCPFVAPAVAVLIPVDHCKPRPFRFLALSALHGRPLEGMHVADRAVAVQVRAVQPRACRKGLVQLAGPCCLPTAHAQPLNAAPPSPRHSGLFLTHYPFAEPRMCASAAHSQDRGLQSALRRPGDEASGGGGSAGGASPRAGAGSPSPKRVTFALPSPLAGTLAASVAATHLQDGSPRGAGGSAAAAQQRPPLARLAVASPALADELLCFMPEVDSPHRPLSPLGLPPLSATRRWPSNEVGAGEAGRESGRFVARLGFVCGASARTCWQHPAAMYRCRTRALPTPAFFPLTPHPTPTPSAGAGGL